MRLSLILLFVLSLSTIQAQETTDQSTNSADYLQVTRYRLHPEELSIENEIDSEKVYIKIYYNNQASIAEDFAYFKPKKNEILFFYGKNKDNNSSEMYFKLDDSLKPIYQKKDFEQLMQVIKVLEYNVFSEDQFSSAEAYAALERV
ncbi:hypothetical protein [Olleya aquimaris]|uniref:Uncharacterized protein n=1 Tax=Olleya aquimaris TaxID=639310 RepID=A0A327R9W0_9FLAO|nr:hypothetical protein [Olleya aquimaris]RAJ13501.1 hypothetical protein LY08_02020 [Olleya aquimaris]